MKCDPSDQSSLENFDPNADDRASLQLFALRIELAYCYLEL